MTEDLMEREAVAPAAKESILRIFSRHVVTPKSVVAAEVTIAGGLIAEVKIACSPSADAIDLGDDLLIPGLVDIHTDNLEKHYQPRPGTTWDNVGAVMAHDAQCAAAGITTVFDSLCLHGERNGLNRGEAFPAMLAAIDEADAAGLLRADHLLHVRCEVTNPGLLGGLMPHIEHPRLRLLSMMDHRPGQRQFSRREVTEEQAAAALELADMCEEHRLRLSELARQRAVTLAAHDDATAEHIEDALRLGGSMAEFPVSEEAARAARAAGMAIAMGAPNLVRGGSHSGNLSAGEAARLGLLDIIASDYIPLSMLRAAFLLAEPPFGWTLPRAIATATSAPADATGLVDRGRIAQGLRADLVQVNWRPGAWPRPVSVWQGGVRVA